MTNNETLAIVKGVLEGPPVQSCQSSGTTRIHLAVFCSDGKYYATRRFPIPPPESKLPGEIFSLVEEIEPTDDGLKAFHDKAKAMARELGLEHVINLD